MHRRNHKHLFFLQDRVFNNFIPNRKLKISSRAFSSSSRWICFEIPQHLHSYIIHKNHNMCIYHSYTLSYARMHHNLHKTNYILPRFYFPQQVKDMFQMKGRGLIPEARRETQFERPYESFPNEGPGLIPETRRETQFERPYKLSSGNRHWINTRSKTRNLSTFCQLSASE